ncbi:ATP-binding cassette domain-containing protein [Ideonella livida]|uniref:ATP-binding cassette domain-containing protein n=1 Tax=Ideonella livida TaxID=2707176 RepID=A0A7C9TJG5_9BURK|nr:ATP-binding cassette domain-containing protein [Ideonella livida]NDY91738.1 ATP-binding cassette domain-containing protein [Ideonella livida]
MSGRAASMPAAGALPLPLVQLHEAGLRLGGVQALQGVSLGLHPGERLALVGPNGAGKTSLLRLLHGLVAPTEGRREVPPQPDGRPPVGAMLFQRPFLLHCSARRNVLLGLWLRGVPRAEREARCALALARVGLADVAQRPARSLSGGQQQRLALARAWALRPDVLFLDEPTASLDPSAKKEVERLIEEVAADGVAIVMSSHNLGQVKRLARRVICLGGGRVLADRPTEDFFHARDLPQEAAQFLQGELPWL